MKLMKIQLKKSHLKLLQTKPQIYKINGLLGHVCYLKMPQVNHNSQSLCNEPTMVS